MNKKKLAKRRANASSSNFKKERIKKSENELRIASKRKGGCEKSTER